MQFERIICSGRFATARSGTAARPVVRFARERNFPASHGTSFRFALCGAASMSRNASSILSESTHFEAQRREMVALQIRDRGVRSERVLAAMSTVPRHEFVPPNQLSAAYSDNALLIGEGQTISQPYVVAAMTEALSLMGSEHVLEIGGGSGYQAAVLSTLAREIIAIELLTQLADAARERLARLGFSNVRVEQADGSLGWAASAPYDAILVAAAAPEIPQPLVEQLAEGGRLVIPVGSVEEQNLLRVVKCAGRVTQQILFACRFVPLRGRHGWRAEPQGIAQE
jgi:protein-L-isoaspartate(D-aspartate) O-methyltransferase